MYAITDVGRSRGRPLGRAAIALLVTLVALLATPRWASAQPLLDDANQWPGDQPQTWTASEPTEPTAPDMSAPPEGWQGGTPRMTPEQFAAPNWSGEDGDAGEEAGYCSSCITRLGLRQYATHGRNVGVGWPMVGTSWLNRPYYVGAEYGTIWITRPVEDSVSRDIDTYGGFFVGWDFDHYWGSEMKFDRATPELINAESPAAERADVLNTWSVSAMYYPWGDSWIRPYWRWGIGNTTFDFPLDNGFRHDAHLLTFPIGLGVKYPIRRWLALRTELTDQWAIGRSGLPMQHNPTLTFGLEWHFGVHTRSYWPWNPSRHIW